MTITKARTEELTSSEIVSAFREVYGLYQKLRGAPISLICDPNAWCVLRAGGHWLATGVCVEDLLVRLHDKWSAELAEAVKAERVEEGK